MKALSTAKISLTSLDSCHCCSPVLHHGPAILNCGSLKPPNSLASLDLHLLAPWPAMHSLPCVQTTTHPSSLTVDVITLRKSPWTPAIGLNTPPVCSNPVLMPITAMNNLYTMAGWLSFSHQAVRFSGTGKIFFFLLDKQCSLGNGEQTYFLENMKLIVFWKRN